MEVSSLVLQYNLWKILQYPPSGIVQQQGAHYMQQAQQQAQQMTQQQQLMAARSSLLYTQQQPYSTLQQQQALQHSQLGMSSGGSSGLHMFQSEATSVGGNAGFPDFARKHDIGSSADGRGGGSSCEGGETLYLRSSDN